MVVSNNYACAFTEVYEILQFLEKDEFAKIPLSLIDIIKNNRNKNYSFSLDLNRKLKEQKILPETKAILFNIFRDYLSTEKQRQKIINWQTEDLRKMDKEKQLKYNVDVFASKNIEDVASPLNENIQLVEIKPQSLWQKIIKKIKAFFK